MYTEQNKKEINWGIIFKRSIIVLGILVLILLVIFLISQINSNSKENAGYDNGKNTTEQGKKKTLEKYSEKYINNFRYLQETGKDYWLYGGLLPENGSIVKLTLGQLINKGLILPFTDKSGNECDQDESYIKLSNIDGKYTMSVKLTCGNEIATISEQLGCNQFCKDNETCKQAIKESELEYQFKQSYNNKENVYTCPSGYKKVGTKCYIASSSAIDATKTTKTFCPAGYEQKRNKCVSKGISIDATVKTNYSCPSGYTLTGDKCYMFSSHSMDATVSAKYTCPYGYDPNGSLCSMMTVNIIPLNNKTTYSCPNANYTLSGKSCSIRTRYTANKISRTYYRCPSGYTSSGSGSDMVCYKYTTSEGKKYFSEYPSNISSSCTYLGRKAKDNCTNNCNKIYYTFYCEGKVKTYKDNIKSTSYDCPSGYDETENTCVKYASKTIDATKNTSGTCPSGYVQNNNQCSGYTTSTVNAYITYDYSCPYGQILSGNKCYYTYSDYINATVYKNYYCQAGYTLDGNKCKINDKVIDAISSTKYTCPANYDKVGSGASTVCIKTNSESINATKSTTDKTKYKYTWSKSSTLDGWISTGLTRKVS